MVFVFDDDFDVEWFVDGIDVGVGFFEFVDFYV